MLRRILAASLALSLVGLPLPARPAVLGVVVQASNGRSNTSPTAAGATIFDGDQLSTGADGVLQLRSPTAVFYLPPDSAITLHSAPQGTHADLRLGTVVISATHVSALDLQADDAHIGPANDGPTSAQISLVSPKELHITTRRGALSFSYHNETEIIPEGGAYRVLLDPPNSSTIRIPAKNQRIKKHERRPKGFIIVSRGTATWLAAWLLHEMVESPSRPED